MLHFTVESAYLKDGDVAKVEDNVVNIWDYRNKLTTRAIKISEHSNNNVEKEGYRHYMLKEIFEQPDVIAATINQYMHPTTGKITMPELSIDLSSVPQITIVACGTSNYAGMVCKYWIEKFAGIPVTVDIASEFRYRESPLKPGGLALFISQSGETADTLAALQLAKDKGQHIISLVNVMESSMAQESEAVLPIVAGPEIGVASTKAFTAQLTALACLAISIADGKGLLTKETRTEITQALAQLPSLVTKILGYDRLIYSMAQEIALAQSALFIGSGTSYPIAMEGALKLKELTYIHAEGIAAGELKHGPLALVDSKIPVIAIAPSDSLFEKTCSNIHEVSARGGKVIVFCDTKGAGFIKNIAPYVIVMPESHPLISPILYTIPLQLLAYHVAVARGNDVDQPRNLAKSVTVE